MVVELPGLLSEENNDRVDGLGPPSVIELAKERALKSARYRFISISPAADSWAAAILSSRDS